MITVVPARVQLSEPSKVLQAVQRDIARVSEYEHVPLSRIQKWVLEGDVRLDVGCNVVLANSNVAL